MLAFDTLCLAVAWTISLLMPRLGGHAAGWEVWSRSFYAVPLTIVAFAISGLYSALGLDLIDQSKRASMCISFVQLGSVCSLWAANAAGGTLRGLLFWALSLALVPLGRAYIQSALSANRWWGEPVLLVGSGEPLETVLRLLTRNRRFGLHPIGVLSHAGEAPGCAVDIPLLQDMETGLSFARRHNIQAAVVVLGAGDLSVSEAANRYGGFFRRLIVVPPASPKFNLWSSAGTLGGYLSIRVSQQLRMRSSLIWKRCLDLAIALPAIIVLLPLTVLIAAAIKLTSRGPVFFGHRRIGRDDVPFKAWKFRTMVSDADTVLAERLATDPELRSEWERDRKLRNDPRVTPIGAFLRKYSLDELPQLWNVVTSEMSIVGPRPICSAEVSKYAEHFTDYLRVLPGITGLWQVSGRNDTTFDQRVAFDTYYVNNWTPWLDLYIIVRTFKAVLTARGAY
jgi:Undecaprenyl-phosphate galactose phosphotransferase WbaP